MSDAPEILWLWPAEPEDGVDKFVSFPGQRYPSGSTTYIRADVVRADLSDALLREAVAALDDARQSLVDSSEEIAELRLTLSKTDLELPWLSDAIDKQTIAIAKLRAHLEGEKE